MTARLLIGSTPHIISEDPTASTATAGTATVKLHARQAFFDVRTTRAGYSFPVVVSIQATTAADYKTARDLVLAQLKNEFQDVLFEQTTGSERITMKTSTGEVVQWVADVIEEQGHLATVMQITFTAITRRASGGGAADPVLNPPGLIDEINFRFYQNHEGTSSWTIIASFVGDGTDAAYILSNEWAEALDTSRPAFLKTAYVRQEKANNLNGITGATQIQLVYVIPTKVKEVTGEPVALPAEVAFAEYASSVEAYTQVDARLTDQPLHFTMAGYVTIKIDDDQTFDPDDPDAALETDTPAKVAAVVQTFLDRALEVYELAGKEAIDLRIDYGRADAGGRATFQIIKIFGTNGYIAAKEETTTPTDDNFTAFPDDGGDDWVFRPVNHVRESATQVLTWASKGETAPPFIAVSGMTLKTTIPTKPTSSTLMVMDLASGQMTEEVEIFMHKLTRVYIKLNSTSGGGGGGAEFGGLPVETTTENTGPRG